MIRLQRRERTKMRYIEWAVMFIVAGLGIALANFVGFQVSFGDSLPGIAILLLISLAAVIISKIIPVKFPVIAYCSLIGLLLASPICPAREYVIEAAGKINFTAPLTMVGAYAGISISDQLKEFARQGWKMLLIAALVMVGTFTCSAIIAQILLSVTHVI
jgi:hypothetical protein